MQVELPASGIGTANPQADLLIVEFGSFTCHYCQTFHDSIFPALKAEYLQPGHASFRFVSIDSAAPLVRLSAWVACATPRMGYDEAMGEAFSFLNRDSLFSLEGLPEVKTELLSECLDRATSARQVEARAAKVLGIQTVPTFLVGAADSTGRVVGWVVEGLHTARLDSTIQAAKKLLTRTVASKK